MSLNELRFNEEEFNRQICTTKLIAHHKSYNIHCTSRILFEYNMYSLAVITVSVFKVLCKFSSLGYVYGYVKICIS